MPNTTNYSFPTPADTDLVKNGADAIRDLGDAVDTAMNTALGTKKAGMVLLNTTSFSGVVTQSINDVFSATYDRYRILVEGTNASTSAVSILMRMRVSAADNSSSNYRWTTVYQRDNSGAPTVAGEGSNGTTTSFSLAGLSSTAGYPSPLSVELVNPFAAKHTSMSYQNYYYDQTGPLGIGYVGSGAMTVTTSYTGFTLISSPSTNMTGTVSVYGYNK
jgi:hypothetical protein